MSQLPSLGKRKLPMLRMPSLGGGGGLLSIKGFLSQRGNTAGSGFTTYTALPPKGTTQAIAFLRGSGSGGGYGGSEEVAVFNCTASDVLTMSIPGITGGTANGSTTTLTLPNGKSWTAAGGGFNAPGAVSSTGSPGAGSQNVIQGGASGGLLAPTSGGINNSNINGSYGSAGGPGYNNGIYTAGGEGYIGFIFLGPG